MRPPGGLSQVVLVVSSDPSSYPRRERGEVEAADDAKFPFLPPVLLNSLPFFLLLLSLQL